MFKNVTFDEAVNLLAKEEAEDLATRLSGRAFVKAFIRPSGISFSLITVNKLNTAVLQYKKQESEVYDGYLLSHVTAIPKITKLGRWSERYYFYPEPVPIVRGFCKLENKLTGSLIQEADDVKLDLFKQNTKVWEGFLAESFYKNNAIIKAIDNFVKSKQK